MAKFVLVGALGAMGQTVEKLAGDDIVFGLDTKKNRLTGPFPVYKSPDLIPEELMEKAQCVLDFSHPSGFPDTIDFAKENKLPLVVATTGLSEKDMELAKEASMQIPIVISANMSQGINAIESILKDLVKLLGNDYDIEIVEKHHRNKIDAPSGTALMLASALNPNPSEPLRVNTSRSAAFGKRKDGEIGIASIRGGTIPGEHTVIFAGDDEIIEIKHTSLSKNIFVNGALRAINWIMDKHHGLYSMQDVLHEGTDGPFVFKEI